MAMSSGGAEGEPMMDINTTPLIDVMLVLLIMFIITIPVQTHAVKLDLPQNTTSSPPPINPTKNEVSINNRDQVLWNGTPIDMTVLRQYLDQSQTLNPVPELHLRPAADARYEVVDEVLAVTKRAKVTKMGFIGNEAYANY
ncbi:ExbD/TolR family protein [Sphingomonas sp.]|uniref:ExbD/TolR family protein n=1 Tax=Sphingomonas sp. TaxID=28214 RepID=UPI003B3AD491